MKKVYTLFLMLLFSSIFVYAQTDKAEADQIIYKMLTNKMQTENWHPEMIIQEKRLKPTAEEGIYIVPGDSFQIRSLRSDYYVMRKNNEWITIHDGRYPMETMVNLLMNRINDNRHKLEIRHHQYGGKRPRITMPMQNLFDLLARNTNLYCSVTFIDINEIRAILVFHQSNLDFIHMLELKINTGKLFDPESTLSGDLYTNIPQNYSKAAFNLNEVEENTVSRRKRTLPSISFHDLKQKVTEEQFQLKLGIKSDSKITQTNVFLNGTKVPAPRGINAVVNDGFDMQYNNMLTLSEGRNTITVEVTNEKGTTTESKTVNYTKPVTVNTDRRIALVIGNSNYKDADKSLRNPSNDATDIAAKLKLLGFDVIQRIDADHRTMTQAVNEFGEQAKQYDVALFYYAGHGIQSRGENYLIPVDANLASEGDMKYECENAGRILDKMEESHCRAKIVILDACRNNPFERSWHRGSTGGGLSVINAPEGTFIAYATNPGNVAQDGLSRNSPYTEALLKMLDEPNLPLENFFKRVLREVKRKTQGAQSPWSSSSFDGDFFFNRK